METVVHVIAFCTVVASSLAEVASCSRRDTPCLEDVHSDYHGVVVLGMVVVIKDGVNVEAVGVISRVRWRCCRLVIGVLLKMRFWI